MIARGDAAAFELTLQVARRDRPAFDPHDRHHDDKECHERERSKSGDAAPSGSAPYDNRIAGVRLVRPLRHWAILTPASRDRSRCGMNPSPRAPTCAVNATARDHAI